MSYGISFTSGSLIPSFCLSIKGRHDAPLLSLCSDGKKSDLALYVYEILLFLSAPCGGRLLNLTVDLLMLPRNIRKRLLRIVGHSICKGRYRSAPLVPKRYHYASFSVIACVSKPYFLNLYLTKFEKSSSCVDKII